MFARLTAYENVDIALADQVKQWVESLDTDPFDQLPGYRGSMTLVDRDNARLVGIGFYASAGQAREADALLTTLFEQARNAGARSHPAGPRHAARQRRPLRGRAPRLSGHGWRLRPRTIASASRWGARRASPTRSSSTVAAARTAARLSSSLPVANISQV